eukprot:CAMPEP_0119007526 /NCGR_PEP_ID=MMETSP1176-20130426/3065_1 /TAXON_ID=265551 /ORGANISM="Synedropsis recta cf, Strain CCMP1620" /LENGTH=525 /DNA_ID=CAMNT_0006959693 /DNA_START=75 /DNA_END=1652 /DNA_ORIENTATION=-
MTDVYKNLESISDFKEFSNARHYVTLPSDWCCLVAHVDGSEQAVSEGRYRDVNNVGAACIMAVKNALNKEEFPYVFVGDGATFVLPEVHRLSAVNALLAFSKIVKKNFKLDLIIGSMYIHEIEQLGATVEVARYEIHSGMCIALFRGGGVTLANHKVQNGEVPEEDATDSVYNTRVNIEGLSCRWNKIPSKHGCIMTILVLDNPKVPGNVYEYVTGQIDAILSRGITHANPVNTEFLTWKSTRQIIREERRFHASTCSISFIVRFFEIMVVVMLFKYKLFQKALFDVPHYIRESKSHADYRKFDDMLRMVIDCTQDQANAIEFMLQDMHQHGHKLFYGVLYSTHSLMACEFSNGTDGNHIHYIDCDNGGYALAAKALKEQMEQRVSDRFAIHKPILETKLDDDDTSLEIDRSTIEGEFSLTFGDDGCIDHCLVFGDYDDQRHHDPSLEASYHDEKHKCRADDDVSIVLEKLEAGQGDFELGAPKGVETEKPRKKKKKKSKSKKKKKKKRVETKATEEAAALVWEA